MDEIGKRLHDNAEKCIKSYEVWQQDKKNQEARESLNESLHELRRATAALEIDMIREERLSGVTRPMPTPVHRSMRKQDDENFGNANDDIGNRGDDGNGNGGGGHENRGPRRSGGGHHRGGGRSGGQHRGGGPRESGNSE
ncbi:MAG: hypothetical protein NDJ24_10205 [Alphaproteobacteria bacterium]|nr:hypothetical protein [Alphaproteobacteria bacterium]